jgi:hypothetical protein
MLVDELLLAVGYQNDGEIVKPPDYAPQLKTVHEKDRDRELVPPGLVEKDVLQALCVLHFLISPCGAAFSGDCIISGRPIK